MKLILVCFAVVCYQTEATWMSKNNCNLRNIFGVHLQVSQILAAADVNNDQKLSKQEDRDSYALYDANKDGLVSRNEFVNKMMNEFCYPKQESSQLFDLFDTNKDSNLSAADTDPNNSLFRFGDADLKLVSLGLRGADKMAQERVRERKIMLEIIKNKYDGYNFLSW